MTSQEWRSLLQPTMISVHRTEFLSCSRCTSRYPLTDIIRCSASIMGESLCPSCHDRSHPSCRNSQTLVKAEDKNCFHCLINTGSVVCPICPINENGHGGMLFCAKCSTLIHQNHTKTHADHFYQPPKLAENIHKL